MVRFLLMMILVLVMMMIVFEKDHFILDSVKALILHSVLGTMLVLGKLSYLDFIKTIKAISISIF